MCFCFAGVRSCTMDINDLPPEVLTKIFSYLPILLVDRIGNLEFGGFLDLRDSDFSQYQKIS
jgi:hypothetical protein